MKKRVIITISVISVLLITCIAFLVIKKGSNQFRNEEFYILYPFDNALFPPEFPAPAIRWRDADKNAGAWEVSLHTKDKGGYFIEEIDDTVVFDTTNFLSFILSI